MTQLQQLFEAVHRIISEEPMLLEVKPNPVYIIGDIHGNYAVCCYLHLYTFTNDRHPCVIIQDLTKFLELFGLLTCGDFIPAKFVFLGGLLSIYMILILCSRRHYDLNRLRG